MRLCQPPDDVVPKTFPIWLEIYCHRRRLTLDACGCDRLDAAVAAADAFIERAKMLHLDGAAEASPSRMLAHSVLRVLQDANLDCRLVVSRPG